MSNMSYCRFENTVSDLRDCYENLDDDLEGYEFRARNELIALCRKIVDAAETSLDVETMEIEAMEAEND